MNKRKLEESPRDNTILQLTNMNKRKLEKSQRDHKFKRRRSIRILKKKFYDLVDKMNSEDLECTLTYMRKKEVFKQLHQYFAAKIIQKNFREWRNKEHFLKKK